MLPILLFVAIVTRTFVQGFGVLFAIFICVFVIPTPFVRPPGPLDPGIRDELLYAGMQWLAIDARQAGVARARRDRILAGVLAPAPGAGARPDGAHRLRHVVLRVAADGVDAVELRRSRSRPAFGPAPAADTARISLRNPRICFPAARRADLSTDAAFVAARSGTASRCGTTRNCADVGPNSVAFLTNIEPRGLPLDWRVKLNYVRADYSAGGVTLYSLRPARYITDHAGGGSLAHAWMLPEAAVQRLRGVQPELELTYSLTLLKPREYQVPTDGKRHALPGLGYCSAKVDEPGNRIDVDCFSAFTHSAQISARAERDLREPRLRQPRGFRAGLRAMAVQQAREAHHRLAATREARQHHGHCVGRGGLISRSRWPCPASSAPISRPAPCPRPRQSLSEGELARRGTARSATPSRVDEGVQLEVLDFGGAGSPILLLPGLGATAHSYDELAPLLAQKHRVVAMTRRGTGDSSKPDFGFDTPRLAQDVLQVMDAMEPRRRSCSSVIPSPAMSSPGSAGIIRNASADSSIWTPPTIVPVTARLPPRCACASLAGFCRPNRPSRRRRC